MKKRSNLNLLMGITIVLLAACSNSNLENAASTITVEDLIARIKVLASDEFEGRAPSSRGEELTIGYLRDQFAALGLKPGNGDSWFQEVPLVSITTSPAAVLSVTGKGAMSSFSFGDEFVAWSKQIVDKVGIEASDLVFVGYGIVAPEYGWDDYAGVDMHGKTAVILVNDPGYATRDEAFFNGYAMTYYGRWTYKFEEAARQGAAGAIIVHQKGPAGYPWDVVGNSWTGPQFDLITEDGNAGRCAVEGWVTEEVGRRIFSQAGLDFDNLTEAATSAEFKPVTMDLAASVALSQEVAHSKSNNVVALLPGSKHPDEFIIYTAHWDHLGKDPNLEGDQIYNGALDNATGTAGLVELAEAFVAMDPVPERSIVFLAVTAEEQGLLGSLYYANHPLTPHEKTLGVINMDGMNIFGPMNDVTVIGMGQSEMEAYAARAARRQKRTLRSDPNVEKGYYYRSDHFSFAKVGVPSLYLDNGIDHVEYGEEWTRKQMDRYTAERYHKPSDEMDVSWDLRGGVDDLRLLLDVGYQLSRANSYPAWKEDSEFKAIREKGLSGK